MRRTGILVKRQVRQHQKQARMHTLLDGSDHRLLCIDPLDDVFFWMNESAQQRRMMSDCMPGKSLAPVMWLFQYKYMISEWFAWPFDRYLACRNDLTIF